MTDLTRTGIAAALGAMAGLAVLGMLELAGITFRIGLSLAVIFLFTLAGTTIETARLRAGLRAEERRLDESMREELSALRERSEPAQTEGERPPDGADGSGTDVSR